MDSDDYFERLHLILAEHQMRLDKQHNFICDQQDDNLKLAKCFKEMANLFVKYVEDQAIAMAMLESRLAELEHEQAKTWWPFGHK